MSAIGKKTVDGASVDAAFVIQKNYCPSRVLSVSNGTTNFGLVKGGTVMGLITASNEYRPCGSSLAVDAGAGATAVIEVADVTRFRVGDGIKINGATSGETILSIATATDKITLTGNATWSIGHEIAVEDGSDVATGIMLYDVATFEKEVDEDGAAVHRDRRCHILRMGVVSASGMAGAGVVEAHLIENLSGFILFDV